MAENLPSGSQVNTTGVMVAFLFFLAYSCISKHFDLLAVVVFEDDGLAASGVAGVVWLIGGVIVGDVWETDDDDELLVTPERN